MFFPLGREKKVGRQYYVVIEEDTVTAAIDWTTLNVLSRNLGLYGGVASMLGPRRLAEQAYRIECARLERAGLLPPLRAKYCGGIR